MAPVLFGGLTVSLMSKTKTAVKNAIQAVHMAQTALGNKVQGAVPNFPWSKGAEGRDAAAKAYHAALAVKSACDRMEEIPKDLMPIYQQAMKAMDAAGEAGKEANQLAEMLRRMANRYS